LVFRVRSRRKLPFFSTSSRFLLLKSVVLQLEN